MKLFKTIALVVFQLVTARILAGNSFVFLNDTTKLFYASNNEIYSPDKSQLLYFQKGNIFFTGSSDSKDNIFLLTTSMDFGSSNLELIYEKENRKPLYSFSEGKFYLGENDSEEWRAKNELLHIKKMKKWLAFYASFNDSLLAYYTADSLPNSAAIIVAYTVIKKFDLEKRVMANDSPLTFTETGFSTIKPVLGNQTGNEWTWDGKILRPRWNMDQRLAWTFDGQIVKPLLGNNIYDQYEWDGENFKPAWRANESLHWIWDGRMMERIYETDWANQYIIEEGIVKPWSNVHPEKEWEMQGDIPIPLIILILSGIARPY